MKKYIKKVAIVGQFGVGKTSLMRQFVKSIFSEEYISTIGVNIEEKTVNVGENEMKMIIWDIAGESSITIVNPSYLRGTHGLFFVADITRSETFLNLKQNISDIRRAVGKDIPMITLLNKCDLLSNDELEKLKTMIPEDDYVMTSAKTGENVEMAFMELANAMTT